jgi:hypothetical protein
VLQFYEVDSFFWHIFLSILLIIEKYQYAHSTLNSGLTGNSHKNLLLDKKLMSIRA